MSFRCSPDSRQTFTHSRHLPAITNQLTAISLLILAVFSSSCGGLKQQATTDGLSKAPSVLYTGADSVRFSGSPRSVSSSLQKESWIAVLPPGELSLEIHSLSLVDRQTGNTIRLNSGDIDLVNNLEVIQNRQIEIEDLGYWRHHRLISVIANPEALLTIQNGSYRLTEFDVELKVESDPDFVTGYTGDIESWNQTQVGQFLTHSVINPQNLAAWYVNNPPLNTDTISISNASLYDLKEKYEQVFQVPVDETGMLQIDGAWCVQTGLDPQNLRPSDIEIYSRGRAVPFTVLGQPDSTFASGARLVFYALENEVRATRVRHYSVCIRKQPEPNSESQMQKPDALAINEDTEIMTRFRRTSVFEEDLELKKKLGAFLSIEELRQVWRPLYVINDPVEFHLPSLAFPPQDATICIHLYKTGNGVPGAQEIAITLNGVGLSKIPADRPGKRKREQSKDDNIWTLTKDTEVLNIVVPVEVLKNNSNVLEIVPKGNPQDLQNAWIDRIEVDYESLFRAESGQLEFRNRIFATQEPLELLDLDYLNAVALDVTNPENPMELTLDSRGGYGVLAHTLEQDSHVVISEGYLITRAPDGVLFEEEFNAENYYNDQVLVITHPLFLEQAEQLSGQHHSIGLQSSVVNVEGIYRHNNSGDLSPESIRQFVSEIITNGKQLQTVILFGDCTSDGRGVAQNDVIDFVPTWIVPEPERDSRVSYASDAWYSWIMGDDEISDLFIGRISVNNVDDAQAIVEKLATTRNEKAEDWHQKSLLFSDGTPFDVSAETALDFSPGNLDTQWVDMNDMIWENNFYLPENVVVPALAKVSPMASRTIRNSFDEGRGLIVYFGHGSPNIWSNQRVWFGGDSENSDNLQLTGLGKLPFLAAFTCSNGAIDYPVPRWNVTIIEDMMRIPDGGIRGAWVPSAPGFPADHTRLLEGFYRGVENQNCPSSGFLAETSRLGYQSIKGETDHSRMYLILGDPTVTLPTETGSFFQKPEPADLKEKDLEVHIPKDQSEPVISIYNSTHDDFETEWIFRVRQSNGNDVELAGKASLDAKKTSIVNPFAEHPGHSVLLQNGFQYEFFLFENEKLTMLRDGVFQPLDGTVYDHAEVQFLNQSFSTNNRWSSNDRPVLNLHLLYSDQAAERYSYIVKAEGSMPIEGNVFSSNPGGHGAIRVQLPVPENSSEGMTPGELLDEIDSFEIAIYPDIDNVRSDQPVLVETIMLNRNLPDLQIDPDSITITPESPAEGVTVFVSGRIVNYGGGVSPAPEVSLFRGKKEMKRAREKIRSLVRDADILPGTLYPWQGAEFRLRWDPDRESGDYPIHVTVNGNRKILESNFLNNELNIDLRFRSGWNLEPRGIRAEPNDKPGFLTLIAEVANTGESTAHNLVVVFFSEQLQDDEYRIGESDIEKIAPGETVEVEFEWDVRGRDLTKQVQPSFYTALRGSMQRVSSLVEN